MIPRRTVVRYFSVFLTVSLAKNKTRVEGLRLSNLVYSVVETYLFVATGRRPELRLAAGCMFSCNRRGKRIRIAVNMDQPKLGAAMFGGSSAALLPDIHTRM